MKKKLVIFLSLTAILLSVTALVILLPWGSNLETEIAVTYTAEETETVEGVLVRSEMQVDIPGGSSVLYVLEDGERAAKNGLLAKVYKNSEDAESSRRIEELQAELTSLQKAADSAGYNSASALTLETIEKQIDLKLSKLNGYEEGGNLTSLFDLRKDLTEMLNKRKVYLQKDSDFSPRISQLGSQISALKSSMGSYNKILAPASGYFFSYSDGLEFITPKDLLNITPAKVDVLKEKAGKAQLSNTAKLVTEYRWYYAFTVPKEKTVRLSAAKIRVRFPSVSNEALLAEVDQMVKAEADNEDTRTACVLSSIDSTSELSESRMIKAELIIKSYTGIKISTKAIRTVEIDGQEVQGVYVLKGNRLTFKQIKPLTAFGNYTICENTQKSGWLALYDEVVTVGKDLYDGKIVR